jgi:hypothetical protein
VNRVHIGTTIEQQRDDGLRPTDDGPMERRASSAVASVHEAGIAVEQRTHRSEIARFRGGVNRMIGVRVSRRDAALMLARLLEDASDLLEAAIAGGLDQRVTLEADLASLRAGAEQNLYGLEMPFTYGVAER